MFQNYLSVAFRNLIKNKLYSAINIIGLAVGLMSCVLIMLFVRDEFSYDKFWKNADSIYRLHTTFAVPGREPFVTVVAQGPAKEALQRFFPNEIEATTRMNGMSPVVRRDDKTFQETIYWTDPETADMFDFDLIAGDMHQALADNSSIALSESMAEKYFGTDNAIGEVLTLTFYSITRDYRVAAVYRDLPHNTVIDLPAMVRIDEKDFEEQSWEFAQWFSVNSVLFYELKPGVNIDLVRNRLDDFANANIEIPSQLGRDIKASDFIKYSTLALPEIQLHPAGGGEMKPTGDIKKVQIFIAIAGLILLIACINFMNLATAKSIQRAREVALRKVLGARRSQLIVQFLGESVLLALIGLVLGLVLVEATLPAFSEMLGKELAFNYADGMTGLILLGLVIAVGVMGGIYPALVLSGFLPARVLKANKSAETGGSAILRNVLVVTQFTISIALIIGTAVVYGQMFYATSMDPGFNKDNLLVVRGTSRSGASDKQEALREEILRLPGVTSVAYSGDRPASGNENNTSVTVPGSENTESVLLGVQTVDYDFFSTYQIQFLAGRNYNRDFATDGRPSAEGAKPGEILNGTIILNESALGRLGFGTPQEALGKAVRLGVGGEPGARIQADLQVIGVVPDTHFQSLRRMVRPEMYMMDTDNHNNLSVRFSGDPARLVSAIEGVWKSMITNVPFSYEFVDEAMAEEFTQEQALAKLLTGFSVLAVAIACLGLYGLASYTAARRTKEIGIRKVLGASVLDIVRLLIWQFSKPVLLANIIAWPIAVWGMMSWLETFPYRLDTWVLGPLCIGAGVVALLIAWVTVGGNAAKVARSNPIKALRYE
ncbi:MAG: ABC transporter permease [Alphaproteobacteria bacterium]|nr:MAG: ABC transporter permease [Alphaproteobacteria bacterium]